MSRYGNGNSATIAEAWRFNEIPDEDIFKIDNQTLMINVGRGNNSSSLADKMCPVVHAIGAWHTVDN